MQNFMELPVQPDEILLWITRRCRRLFASCASEKGNRASSKHNCPYCSDVASWVDQNRQSLTIGQLYDIWGLCQIPSTSWRNWWGKSIEESSNLQQHNKLATNPGPIWPEDIGTNHIVSGELSQKYRSTDNRRNQKYEGAKIGTHS